jgi:hypothetical protein
MYVMPVELTIEYQYVFLRVLIRKLGVPFFIIELLQFERLFSLVQIEGEALQRSIDKLQAKSHGRVQYHWYVVCGYRFN